MATSALSTCGLWSLILTASLILTGCLGADSITNKTGLGVGETYTVGSVLVKPFLMLREGSQGGPDAEYEGFIPDLLQELAPIIGKVNFKIRVQPDGKFGAKDADGHWDGLVGSLIRQEIDVAAAPMTITSVRNRVMDFNKRFMSTGAAMVISDSTPDKPSASGLGLIFKPFTPVAWCMLIAGLVITVVFAVIVHRLNPQENKTGHMASVATQLTTCSSGGQYSGCVLRTTMLLFVVLTVVLYTVGMMSFHPAQTYKVQRQRYQGVDDIVRSGEYKIVMVRGGATEMFFRGSTVALYERIYVQRTLVDSVGDGFDLVLKEPGHAFITDRALVDYYMSRKPYCGLHIVGENLNSNGYGLGLPIGSALREVIDLSILQLHEDNILDKLYKKWWYDLGSCGKKHAVQWKKQPIPASAGVDSSTLGGVLIILAVGLLLAVGVAVVERFLRLQSSKVPDSATA